MTKKATDIVAYITIIGWGISWFIGTKDESKFHLNQGLIVGVFELALLLLGMIPIVGGIIGAIGGLIALGLSVLGIINAYNDQENELPVVGGIKVLK